MTGARVSVIPRAEAGEMANEEHLRILKQGVTAWNQWREDHPDEIARICYEHAHYTRFIQESWREILGLFVSSDGHPQISQEILA